MCVYQVLRETLLCLGLIFASMLFSGVAQADENTFTCRPNISVEECSYGASTAREAEENARKGAIAKNQAKEAAARAVAIAKTQKDADDARKVADLAARRADMQIARAESTPTPAQIRNFELAACIDNDHGAANAVSSEQQRGFARNALIVCKQAAKDYLSAWAADKKVSHTTACWDELNAATAIAYSAKYDVDPAIPGQVAFNFAQDVIHNCGGDVVFRAHQLQDMLTGNYLNP